MEIGKYIDELIKLRQAHGADVEVMRSTTAVEGAVNVRGVAKAALPRIAHMQLAHTRTLFREGTDPDRLKGVKVVVVR